MLDYSNVESSVNELLKKFDELNQEELTQLLSAVGLLHTFYQLRTSEALSIFAQLTKKISEKQAEAKDV